MTGYRFEQIIHNKLIYLRSNRHAESFYDKFWEEFDRDGIWFGELWVRCESGKEILCSLEAFHISDDELEEYLRVLIFNNITEKRRAEEELSFLARYDALTGLPNRNLFNDRLEHAIALAKRHNHQVAVMFIDLDGFKKVNDSFGHHAGDVLLKQTADIIRSCLRDEDTLARLSGDEFIVIIEDYQSDAQLKVVLNKIMAKLQQPMDIVQNKVVISCSIGVSQFPLDGSSAEELMKFADTAMYHAKEQGKNQYYFYQKEMHQKLIHRLNIENYLRDAVAKDELYLVFQPIVDVVSHKIVSAEALIRWNNPSLGEVYPMDFIPLAEESGYILEVGRYVLKKACYYIAKWQEDYGNKVKIAVNVSVRQLMDSDFVNDLANIIKESGVNADSLKVEVTESMLMANAGKANQILRDLKNLGVTVSIDDFGTGYSSLSYLKRFAIDELKIDKEFISDITEEGEEETIVNAIIALAKSLSLKVVAEGVETKIQLDYLASHHCDYAQGYLFSKPCKPEELELFLAGKKTFDKTIG
jgi:diguanylate cyclase (GGDEF)-like protein